MSGSWESRVGHVVGLQWGPDTGYPKEIQSRVWIALDFLLYHSLLSASEADQSRALLWGEKSMLS